MLVPKGQVGMGWSDLKFHRQYSAVLLEIRALFLVLGPAPYFHLVDSIVIWALCLVAFYM